jgi:hypothetical protein
MDVGVESEMEKMEYEMNGVSVEGGFAFEKDLGVKLHGTIILFGNVRDLNLYSNYNRGLNRRPIWDHLTKMQRPLQKLMLLSLELIDVMYVLFEKYKSGRPVKKSPASWPLCGLYLAVICYPTVIWALSGLYLTVCWPLSCRYLAFI